MGISCAAFEADEVGGSLNDAGLSPCNWSEICNIVPSARLCLHVEGRGTRAITAFCILLFDAPCVK